MTELMLSSPLTKNDQWDTEQATLPAGLHVFYAKNLAPGA